MNPSKADVASHGSLGSSPLTTNENRLQNMTLNQLSVCLMKTQVMSLVMTLPMRTPSKNVVRICLKILSLVIST